ncbi:MAG: MtnX-like HAD-IB family phosphatase [bacterium]|jgi:2,3-diketo-5-methylthio-1-phosphopentane phosphatase
MSDASLFIDFDGTISPVDISNTFFTRFAAPEASEAVEEWKQGRISSTECLRRELAAYKGDITALREFARNQEMDEGFLRIKEVCERRGIDIFIVSDGLDYYIRPFLARHGIDETLYTNCLDVEGAGPSLSFPYYNEECGRCANCKSSHVKKARDAGKVIIYVGDGLSDKCAAAQADVLFAKRDLAAYCDENGIPHIRFDNLDEVAKSIMSADLAGASRNE